MNCKNLFLEENEKLIIARHEEAFSFILPLLVSLILLGSSLTDAGFLVMSLVVSEIRHCGSSFAQALYNHLLTQTDASKGADSSRGYL